MIERTKQLVLEFRCLRDFYCDDGKIVQKPKLIFEKSGPSCDIILSYASSTSALSISMNFVSIPSHLSSLSQARLPASLMPQQTRTSFLRWECQSSHLLELEKWSARSRHALITQSVRIIHRKYKVFLYLHRTELAQCTQTESETGKTSLCRSNGEKT